MSAVLAGVRAVQVVNSRGGCHGDMETFDNLQDLQIDAYSVSLDTMGRCAPERVTIWRAYLENKRTTMWRTIREQSESQAVVDFDCEIYMRKTEPEEIG